MRISALRHREGQGNCGDLTFGVRKSHVQLDFFQEKTARTRILKEKIKKREKKILNQSTDSHICCKVW